ncbi:MAG TPA: TolC family protein [Candidatus Xenobia bacterium]|jgi:cobalt-zinc-cadmium efflux system outer membrane protein
MTLPQALQAAETNSPTLRAAQFQSKEAWESYLSAQHIPPLTLTIGALTGSNTIVTTNGLSYDVNVQLQQEFGPINNQAWQARVAQRAWEAAEANVVETRATLVQNVKDAFYGLLVAQENRTLAKETLDLANDIYEKSKKRYDAGAGPRMDLVSAQIQLASSQQAMLTAQSAVNQAHITLDGLLAPQTSGELEGSMVLPDVPTDLDKLTRLAHDTRGLMRSAQANVQQALDQVHQVGSLRNPSPSFFFDYDLVNTSLYSYGLNISIPIVDWGQLRHQIRNARETVGEKRANLEQTTINIDGAVAAALDNYRTALQNASTFQTQVLEPSETLMKMTQAGFDKGALTYLQVLTAEQTLKGARAQYESLLQSGHQALDALEASVGTTLEGDHR